jgi:hypothetical protein
MYLVIEDQLMRGYPQPTALGSEPFADVPVSHWAHGQIQQARGLGLVTGYGNQFRPNDPVTRAELAVLFQRFLNLADDPELRLFPDVGATYSWAMPAIRALAAHGLLSGFPDGTFRPRDNATRAQIGTILSRLTRSGVGAE